MSDSEDDSPRLSTEAQAALQEFFTQQAEKDKRCRILLEGKEISPQDIQFDEDWVCVHSMLLTIELSCLGKQWILLSDVVLS
jgi:hypothetical protein